MICTRCSTVTSSAVAAKTAAAAAPAARARRAASFASDVGAASAAARRASASATSAATRIACGERRRSARARGGGRGIPRVGGLLGSSFSVEGIFTRISGKKDRNFRQGSRGRGAAMGRGCLASGSAASLSVLRGVDGDAGECRQPDADALRVCGLPLGSDAVVGRGLGGVGATTCHNHSRPAAAGVSWAAHLRVVRRTRTPMRSPHPPLP